MIIEYKILSSRCDEDLVDKVNDHIKLGWEPMGGHQRHASYSAQAMILRKSEKETIDEVKLRD